MAIELLPSTMREPYERVIRPHLPATKPTIFVVTVLTWIFCIMTVSKCKFFVKESLVEDGDDMEMGLFSRSVYDTDGDILGCVAYTDRETDFIDDMFKVGRAFAIIAALCSSIVVLFVCAALLFRPKGCEVLWSAAGFYSAAGTVGQMFSFFVLNSQHCQSAQYTCRLSGVGKLAVVNVLLMAALSIKLFLEAAPRLPWVGWYKDAVEEETVASNKSGSQNSKKKEILSVIDPFSAEFVPSEEDHRHEVLEMEEIEPVQMSTGASAASHGSGHSQQSIQENLASSLGVQSLKSFRIALMGFITLAWVVTVVGVHHCTFMLVGPAGGERSDFSGLGLFSRAAYYQGELIGCLAYPDETTARFDQSFQTGRTFGVISALLMTLVLVLSFLQLFVKVAKDEIWLVTRVLLPFATVSQLLVFFSYKTDTCTMTDLIDCRPGGAGIAVIVNIFLQVSLSIVVLLVPPPPSPLLSMCPHEPDRQGAQQPQRSMNNNYKRSTTGNSNSRILPGYPSPSRPSQQFRTHMCPIPEAPSKELDDSPSTNTTSTPPHTQGLTPRKSVRIAEDATETITVRVEYDGNVKKTVKTLTYADGSKTITTTIEELNKVDEVEDEEFSQAQDQREEAYLYQLEEVSLGKEDLKPDSEDDKPDSEDDKPVIGTVRNLRQLFERGS